MSPKRGIRKICRYLIYSCFFQVDLSERSINIHGQGGKKSILNRKIPDFFRGEGEAAKFDAFLSTIIYLIVLESLCVLVHPLQSK